MPQVKSYEYEESLHDKWHALTVKQPYADALVTAAYKDDMDNVFGVKSIEVRSKNTKYRGDVMICAARNPELEGHIAGVTLGLVELYDVKPIKDFTPEDWEKTRIPAYKREKITKGYGWLMRNPRKVIEYPVKGQLGIYTLCYTKGEVIEYPRSVVLDEKSWKQIQKNMNNEK